MRTLFSYLMVMLAGIFWLFRLVIAVTDTMSVDIGITPINSNVEIILLFVTMFAMILIIKRSIIGALVYFASYGLYFGTDLYNVIIKIINKSATTGEYFNLLISLIGIVIPFLIVMDILLNKDRKAAVRDKNTDWFYTNEEYTRKFDERADRNQYKF